MPHFARMALAFLSCTAWSVAIAGVDLDREIALAPHGGAGKEDAEIVRWQEKARHDLAKADVFERLGWAYIAKARHTLDAGFYKLAEKTAEVMEAQFGRGGSSQLLRAHALHNLHRFSEAETIARALVAESDLPAGYALLSDVLMEQGRLEEAVQALQRLVNLKPGAEAYTRIAHMRWLKGDLAGAISAMDMAARATSPAETEIAAWTLVRLSGLHLQAGNAPRALAMADDACRRAAEFAPALLARGRALVALDKMEAAAVALERAATLNPLPEYQWWLADVWRAMGRAEEASKVESALHARGAADDPRTYALFLATRGEAGAKAVKLAREELTQRQDVFSHDALAWALANAGDLPAAEVAMAAALAEKTRDARLFLHAGEIARMGGQRDRAMEFFARAREAAGTLTPSERARLSRHGKEFSSVVTQTQP